VSQALGALSPAALRDLASAIEGGTVAPPFRPVALSRRGFDGDGISADLAQLASLGLPPAGVAHVLRLLATERQLAQQASDRTELVWTGPETHSARSRDTSVVVRELFASAERSVLVSSYAVFQGRQVFHPLAARMAAIPALRVKLFLNVARAHGDVAPENQLLEAFADTFRAEHWPGARLPEVFYDPRSLALGLGEKAVLHAKTIVVDDARVFVTSANFTEAAHQRNIEAGVVVHSASLAVSLRLQFDTLVEAGMLRQLPMKR